MPPVFPTNAELTSFDGPAENPLSDSGRWAEYGNRDPLQRTGTGLVIPTQEFSVNGMYWTRNVFPSPCEAWACRSGGGLGAANESWRVLLLLDDPNGATGYLSAYGGGIGEFYFVRRYDGGSFDNFVTLGIVDTTNPSKVGIRITASSVEQWAFFGGVWNLLQSFNDTTYRGVFFAAIEMEEQGSVGNVSMGCFGGGIINRQHIYRILRGQPGVPA